MSNITEQIQVYADNVQIDCGDKDTVAVLLTGIDVEQVVSEFSTRELLEAITANDNFSDIVDYVSQINLENS